jgi:hypothetical protein
MGDHELIKKKTENYQKKTFSWSSVAIGIYFFYKVAYYIPCGKFSTIV